jgi:Tol biopolymer transport system component
MLHRPLALAVALSLSSAALAGEKADAPKWDVNAAHGPVKQVKFTTDEGTWMDLDVSRDGQTLVFSLLGDLYTLPIAGGSATRITSGPAWDVQPRFSPDGAEIAFASDRAGGNNLWRAKRDGSGATQVSKEDYRLLNNPAWTPDGQYLIGRKHFTSERSLGAGELWMYHKTGGAGLQLTKKKNDQQDLGEPAVSADGRYVYYSEDVSGGTTFEYNKNPHGVIYAIKRLDRETGETETIVATPGGAVRPQPSPDGKSLAFVKRVADKSVLHRIDLATGEVKPLWDGLSHDQQEGWAVFGPYANYQWLPDSSAVVIWAQGKLWRVDAATGSQTAIPFSANVEQTVAAPLRFERQLDAGAFTAKMIRDVATSPDGLTVVFHAVGQLWTRALPDELPQRLTTRSDAFEYQPSFSADGKKLLYTTWSDAKQGTIVERDLASGSERVLTSQPGFYYSPRYSRDGSKIVWSKQSGSSLTGSLNSGEQGIWWMPAAGGDATRIAKDGYEPQFTADGRRVTFLSGGGLSKKLQSVGLHGEEPRDVFSLKYTDFVSVSPDGQWVAFTELFNAYVAPMPKTGGVIELGKESTAIPVARISTDVGSYLHWANDSSAVHWMVGDQYYTRSLKDAFAFVPGAPAKLPDAKTLKGVSMGLSVPVDAPKDVVAFTHARIVSMKGDEVIERGTVLIEGDTIKAVGANVAVPANARTIDASGKTIVPGYVDVHAHANHFNTGVIAQQNWAYYANLAFGVTTMHDPSATTEFVFSQAELQKAGQAGGPARVLDRHHPVRRRWRLQGGGEFARRCARAPARMQANGAFSVKSYNQPRRDQRQQINQAARELGMLVVEEGGSTLEPQPDNGAGWRDQR